MRMVFYVLVAFIALCSPALAGERDCEDCYVVKHGVHRKVIPTPDYTCFFFVQPHRGNVYLKLYLRDGRIRPYTKQNAPTHGRICVGRSWVRLMTEESFICDEKTSHFVYGVRGMIETLATKPAYSRAVEACLNGKDECNRMGYP